MVTNGRIRAPHPAFRPVLLAAAMLALGANAAAAAAGERSGQAVYEAVCAECHASGTMNAPVFGDRKAWKRLIAEGQRELVREAIRGVRRMPPRGGDPSLTDREVERAVVHMANAAGGRFREPK